MPRTKLLALFLIIAVSSTGSADPKNVEAACDAGLIEALKSMSQEDVWDPNQSLQRQMLAQQFVDSQSLTKLSQLGFEDVQKLFAGAPVEALALVMRLVVTRLKSDGAYPFEEPVIFDGGSFGQIILNKDCLLYTSPSPRDQRGSRMPSSA